jgi:hypothetical protein
VTWSAAAASKRRIVGHCVDFSGRHVRFDVRERICGMRDPAHRLNCVRLLAVLESPGEADEQLFGHLRHVGLKKDDP